MGRLEGDNGAVVTLQRGTAPRCCAWCSCPLCRLTRIPAPAQSTQFPSATNICVLLQIIYPLPYQLGILAPFIITWWQRCFEGLRLGEEQELRWRSYLL